jgi:hypothetical protein
MKKEKLAYRLADEDSEKIAFLTEEEATSCSEEYEVIRAQEYDKYLEIGYVPIQVLLDDGWWFECHFCGQKVDAEAWDYNDDLPLDLVVLDRHIFCSQSCHDSYMNRKEYYRSEKQKWTNYLMQSFPQITSLHVVVGDDRTYAQFLVPGCKYKVNWYSDNKGILNHSIADTDAINKYLSGIA